MFNPLDFTGRRYLITGAASGMGRETALYLSGLGADLLLVDINQELLIVVQQECRSKVSILVEDLSQSQDLSNLILQDVQLNGKLHGIIHCAGIPYIAPLKMINREKTEKVLAVNSVAALELVKIFCNRKIYAGEKGAVVLISSVYGLVGSAANVAYAMSKGAIQSMTKALAIELASRRIRVNCIAPGFVKSPMGDLINHNFDSSYEEVIEHMHPLGWGEPKDIAAGVAYLLSDMAKWVTGAIISIDGGFTAQ